VGVVHRQRPIRVLPAQDDRVAIAVEARRDSAQDLDPGRVRGRLSLEFDPLDP
jgi:hypothetical protein